MTMDEQFRILVVEDDETTCMHFQNAISNYSDMTITAMTNSSDKAFGIVRSTLPNAVILDLELTKGSGNGLFFLQQMQKAILPFRPFILITTNNSSQTIYGCAHDLGADFILYKHQEDYSEDMALSFLHSLKSSILQNTSASSKEPVPSRNLIPQRLVSEFNLIGMSPKAKGYQYLIDSVLLCLEDPEAKWCHIVATKYQKSEASVERAMQNVIKRTWTTSDTEDLYKYYTGNIRPEKGFPTLTEFIFYYVHKIRTNFMP